MNERDTDILFQYLEQIVKGVNRIAYAIEESNSYCVEGIRADLEMPECGAYAPDFVEEGK